MFNELRTILQECYLTSLDEFIGLFLNILLLVMTSAALPNSLFFYSLIDLHSWDVKNPQILQLDYKVLQKLLPTTFCLIISDLACLNP